MDKPNGEMDWAAQEFGGADLGDTRRTKRLVDVAAELARRPGGRITDVFGDGAEREGAYRLVENDEVVPRALGTASSQATLERAQGMERVFVPVDGTSLSLTDELGQKGLGKVGARQKGATGLQVMNAIAVGPDGTPLGLCGQVYWARCKRSTRTSDKSDTRPLAQKETRYWLELMDETRTLFDGSSVRPWFQLDRGGDAGAVLLDGLLGFGDFTVRSAYDRRVQTDDDAARQYLRAAVENGVEVGQYELKVSAGSGRKTRIAEMCIRVAQVTLLLSEPGQSKKIPTRCSLLLAREGATAPRGERPIDWLLITNITIATRDDALLVLRGYASRWRVEEFHKAWKSGACHVEENQLRSAAAIERWARIEAAVAMRVLRLTYVARSTPDTAAAVELRPSELRILPLMAKKNRYKPTFDGDAAALPMGIAVEWIAQLGGYTGRKSSGGPPGAIVITRGLRRLVDAAAAIDLLEK